MPRVQARANLLDVMLASSGSSGASSSSSSSSSSDSGDEPADYQHLHRLHRFRRQKKGNTAISEPLTELSTPVVYRAEMGTLRSSKHEAILLYVLTAD